MKLVCPNCDAQYAVDKSVIPAAGRDVQCSNCGSMWFQRPESAAEAESHGEDMGDQAPGALSSAQPRDGSVWDGETPAPRASPFDGPERGEGMPSDAAEHSRAVAFGAAPRPAEPLEEERPRRAVDTAVLEVLREEAEREKAARMADGYRTAGPAAEAPAAEDRAPSQAVVAPPPAPNSDRAAPEVPAETDLVAPIGGGATARRDALPDIEQINSTLRASADPERDVQAELDEEYEARETRRRGFRYGYAMTLALFALAVLAYTNSERLASWIPAAKAPLQSYVAKVDSGRVWLDEKARSLSQSAPSAQ